MGIGACQWQGTELPKCFPHHANGACLQTELIKRHRLDGVGTEAIAVIDALQPYLRPDPPSTPLAVLDKLQNINKHRRVLLTGWTAIENFDLVAPLSGKLVHVANYDPAISEEDKIFTFVSVTETQGRVEVATFIDGLAGYFINVLLPMFDQFFE
jgi:hypothetical protein